MRASPIEATVRGGHPPYARDESDGQEHNDSQLVCLSDPERRVVMAIDPHDDGRELEAWGRGGHIHLEGAL